MSEIALFHSVLGLREGILDAAERLRGAGHQVLVVDQYEGRVFNDYGEASAFAEAIGYSALMQRAASAVEALSDDFVAVGFSNGGGMAKYVATLRPVGGVIMLSGALPLETIAVDAWPSGVPAQIHYALDDPFRRQDWIDAVVEAVRRAPANDPDLRLPRLRASLHGRVAARRIRPRSLRAPLGTGPRILRGAAARQGGGGACGSRRMHEPAREPRAIELAN